VAVAEIEAIVTAFVAALAYCERAFVEKTIELRDIAEFSRITHELETSQDALSISAHIDAALPDARGVTWTICLWRSDSAWTIDREVTLYPNRGDDVVHRLPEIECDSEELGRSLPAWTDELLRLRVPPFPQTDT
jgi:hypothetical protein